MLTHLLDHGTDVIRPGAAATADDVKKTVGGPVGQLTGHRPGGLIVTAKLIGQTGVGVGGDVALGNAG